MNFAELPLSTEFLENYRLEARRQRRPNLLGGHITRRMGQSLEFREFAPYNLGDDIRYVDWRASHRTRTGNKMQAGGGWLVRKFRAEEHLKLVISLDTRETMMYPQPQPERRTAHPDLANISKLQLARWLAAAIAFVALRSDDQVVLHRLFGQPTDCIPLRGSRGIEQINSSLDTISDKENDKMETPNLANLERYLPPTVVWLIITDFYFDLDQAQQLVDRIITAQDGMRWVILVNLDSWPYEKHVVQRSRLCLIDGPGPNPDQKMRFDTSNLDTVEERIRQHTSQLLQSCLRSEKPVHWKYEAKELEKETAFATFFKKQFTDDDIIGRLFERETWW